MALLFCDSFDHYATADLPKKYGTSVGLVISPTSARFGAGGVYANGSDHVQNSFTNQATWIVGVAMRYDTLGANGFIRILDGSTTQTDLRFDGASRPYFSRNGTQIGDIASISLSASVWYYIEVKVTINDTTGVAILKINGQTVLNGTGLNTRSTANSYGNGVRVGATATSGTSLHFDDLYICDGSGSVNNDFLGDIKVECLLPSGAGATTAWTPSSGANYTCVDEASINSDTDYVSSSTANQVDTYAMENLSTTAGTIKGVQYLLGARKDDAGTRQVAPVARPASTDRVGTTVSLGNSYTYVREIAELNPEDSAAWDIADVNGMEFGIKLIA